MAIKSTTNEYKDKAKKIVQRLKGNRFEESRRQLSDGDFPLEDFVKGKTPQKQRKQAGATNAPPARAKINT